MKSLHFSLIGLFAVVLFLPIATAQGELSSDPALSTQQDADIQFESYRPIGSSLGTIRVMGSEVNIYEQPGEPRNVLFVSVFGWRLNDGGQVEVRQRTKAKLSPKALEQGADMARLRITLVRNPAGISQQIAEELNRQGIKKGITPANVIPADIAHLKVEDVTPGIAKEYRFASWESTNFTGQEVELHVFIPNGETEGFIDYVQEGNTRFKISQTVAANAVEKSASFASTRAMGMMISVMRDVLGDVAVGDFQKGEPIRMTRSQQLDIEQKLELAQSGSILLGSDAELNQLVLEAVMTSFQRSLSSESLSLEDQEGWKSLKLYDPTVDVEPTRIKELVNSLKTQAESKQVIDESGSISGSSGGLFRSRKRGSSFKFHHENENKQSSDFKTEVRGEITVPVGLNLAQLDSNKIKRLIQIGFRADRVRQATQQLFHEIGTREPAAWRIRDVLLERYDGTQESVTALNTHLDQLPSAFKVRINSDKQTAVQPIRLREQSSESVVNLPSQAGDAGIDREKLYVLSIEMVSPDGEAVYGQIYFFGNSVGPLGQIGPIRFFLRGAEVRAMLQPPQRYEQSSIFK